jgi:hypothetical protein
MFGQLSTWELGLCSAISCAHTLWTLPVGHLILVRGSLGEAPVDEIKGFPQSIFIVDGSIPNLDGTVDYASIVI